MKRAPPTRITVLEVLFHLPSSVVPRKRYTPQNVQINKLRSHRKFKSFPFACDEFSSFLDSFVSADAIKCVRTSPHASCNGFAFLLYFYTVAIDSLPHFYTVQRYNYSILVHNRL